MPAGSTPPPNVLGALTGRARHLAGGGSWLDGGHGRGLRRDEDDLLVVDEVRKQVGGDRGPTRRAADSATSTPPAISLEPVVMRSEQSRPLF